MGSQVLPTDMLGDITSSSKWVGEPDYVDGRCPEVSGVLVPSRCSLDFTPVTSTVASPNPPATISEASSAIEKSYMSPFPKCPIPDLKFVKKFTRPNFWANEFYTLKTRKLRLFSPAIYSKNASLSVIWPPFG